MRVIKSQVKNSEYPKQTNCEYCGIELEYELQDEHIGWMGEKYITCPECGKESCVNEDRQIKPTYPITFHHTDAVNGEAVEIGDEQTQKYVDEVVKYLIEHDDEWACSTGTGNTMVFAFKYDGDDGIDIYVAKNYWNDTLFPEEYWMVK